MTGVGPRVGEVQVEVDGQACIPGTLRQGDVVVEVIDAVRRVYPDTLAGSELEVVLVADTYSM